MYLSGSDGDIISHHCPHGFLLQTTAGTGNDITISLIPDNICIGEKKNTSLQSSTRSRTTGREKASVRQAKETSHEYLLVSLAIKPIR